VKVGDLVRIISPKVTHLSGDDAIGIVVHINETKTLVKVQILTGHWQMKIKALITKWVEVIK
tara:strand:+ start:276 stop:461 length:186 start_codon:yes stop_codon:yes gene_type:complete